MARLGRRACALVALVVSLSPRAVALEVTVRAEVHEDGRTVTGTLRLTPGEGGPASALIDPLARLPAPTSDREVLRRFPRTVESGSVTWTADPDGLLRFTTHLPERFGDVGWLPREGLRANGGWYPTPVDAAGRALTAEWDVEVRAEAAAAVMLNGGGRACVDVRPAGPRCVAWRGRADRLALAVLPSAGDGSLGGWETSNGAGLPGDAGAWYSVGATHEPARVGRALGGAVSRVRSVLTEPDTDIMFVRTRDPERLVHVGPGIVYLSDRAFRVWPRPLERWHRVAVDRAVLAAACRSCAGSREAMVLATLRTPSPRSVRHSLALGIGALVDLAMPDPGIPAWAEMYDRPWRGSPDLGEVLDGGVPAAAIAGQVRALGADVVARVDASLAAGATLAEAASAAGVADDAIAGWTARSQEPVSLVVTPAEDGAVVVRSVLGDGEPAAAIVPIEVDGEPTAWVAAPGETRHVLAGARQVRVDPTGTLPEPDRGDNNLPRSWGGRAGGGISAISVTEGTFDASFSALLRHREDTRRAWTVAGSHDAQDLLTFQVGRLFQLGRLVRAREREWRLTPWAGASLLDRDFAGAAVAEPVPVGGSAPSSVPDLGVPLAGSVGVTLVRDTMEDPFFPLNGSRVALTASAGGVAAEGALVGGWAGTNLSVVRVRALSLRHAFAGRVRAGWVGGETSQRLLPLGGSLDVRAIGETAGVGNVRVSAAAEYRARPWSALRVPVGVGWLTELHLSPGFEAGRIWANGASAGAVGATLGGHGTLEVGGLLPTSGGVTLAWPLWAEGVPAGGLQVYADVLHAF